VPISSLKYNGEPGCAWPGAGGSETTSLSVTQSERIVLAMAVWDVADETYVLQ